MSDKLATLWRCPACDLPLMRNQKKWLCENKHSFDVAKEGYVNLLLAQHKNSKIPGDSKEMVMARREFLSQNHYLPLATRIVQLLKSELMCTTHKGAPKPPISIFDAGCGEGYYLNVIADYLLADLPQSDDVKVSFAGIDIAKAAIRKAAKRKTTGVQTALAFAVASTFNIPLQSNSQNAVMQIFAPSKNEEIQRILKPQGIWITVTPSSDHLFELKEMVYDRPEKHAHQSVEESGFEVVSKETLKFTIALNDKLRRKNLLMMTPYYWTISATKKEFLLDQLLKVSAHFDIKLSRKL